MIKRRNMEPVTVKITYEWTCPKCNKKNFKQEYIIKDFLKCKVCGYVIEREEEDRAFTGR